MRRYIVETSDGLKIIDASSHEFFEQDQVLILYDENGQRLCSFSPEEYKSFDILELSRRH